MPERCCIYCGCTDDRACQIPVEAIHDPEILMAALAEQGVLSAPPNVIACWWVSLDPPGCSNPECERRLASARAFDETTGDPSRVVFGQGSV